MKMFKSVLVLSLVLVCSMSAVFAEQFISVNDLEAMAVTAKTEYDGFIFNAIDGKAINIEMIDQPRTAEDGEIFNGRIKLNGSGNLEYRSIHFSVKAKAKLTVYLNSSSKTDARILALVSTDGTEIATMTAPPDTGTVAGIAVVEIPAPGSYAIFSKGSGINIYQIIIE